jgi:FMN-dependent oxidoreductase (nitrilotriacetate monooxygenase family)
MMPHRQLHFGLNTLSAGMHPAAWLMPEADPLGYIKTSQWLRLAKIAEKGKLDALFLADEPGVSLGPDGTLAGPFFAAIDPVVLLSSLAAVTTHLGLAATISTTYEEPFNVARRVASLDHVSHGRAAWNIVTTADGSVAGNFGVRPHADREERYDRAREFVDVVRGLWDSWDDDAQVADKARQVFTRPGTIRPINYRGKHFHVDGPLNVPRSPQGHPVLIQAGGSAAGIDLAARYADAVFAAAASLEDALTYTKELRRRTAAYGRPADAVRVMPGFSFVLGGTEAEARKRNAELNELAGERRRLWLAWQISVDPDELKWDEPLPEWLLNTKVPASGSQGARDIVLNIARRERLTLRQILDRVLTWHRLVIGSPEQLADAIEDWFVAGAVDGFNLMPDVNPVGIEDFVEQVLPILQRRGLFRTEYAGTTLREHLGLSRPDRLSRAA